MWAARPRRQRWAGWRPCCHSWKPLAPIKCSEGRAPALYRPVSMSRFMLGLYSRRTLRLSAFGLVVGDIHQIRVKASLTRARSLFTHSIGEGRRAGLYQMNSWQR